MSITVSVVLFDMERKLTKPESPTALMKPWLYVRFRLEFAQGKLLAIIGARHSGKSTLLRTGMEITKSLQAATIAVKGR